MPSSMPRCWPIPAPSARGRDLDVVLALLSRHQAELRAEAAEVCGRLLAEKPDAFAARIARLWDLAAEAPDPAAPPEPVPA